ncbi:VOC family protein [Sphingobium sp.]|uniref:VOC family protein n=1 Tax=Sphingobium sp. TaxID=1912891 RepID=UPI002C8DA5DF|nr:VOC family protein [Sphingobium sp.]HUD91566.1 VOC family protein [Sphingobium sp.]
MPVTLNHIIVHAADPAATAAFYVDILNLPPARQLGHFTVLQVGETSLDMLQTDQAIAASHFAFLVSEAEFTDVMMRIEKRGLRYWADPFHTLAGAINHWDDGRGVYFDDPNGHILEVLTRPYGSGGPDAAHPNPLLPVAGV